MKSGRLETGLSADLAGARARHARGDQLPNDNKTTNIIPDSSDNKHNSKSTTWPTRKTEIAVDYFGVQ